MFDSIISVPFGKLGIKVDLGHSKLTHIEFLPKEKNFSVKLSDLTLVKKVVAQLQ